MKIKDGVLWERDGKEVQAPTLYAMAKAQEVMAPFGPVVVTSLMDGDHMPTSLHYAGMALDLRTRGIGPGQQAEIVAALKAALGASYDVVLEGDHIHVEYDPKVG